MHVYIVRAALSGLLVRIANQHRCKLLKVRRRIPGCVISQYRQVAKRQKTKRERFL